MGLDAGYGIGSLKPGVCTSSTRPASPFDGQVVYETDTNLVKAYNGSAWETVNPISNVASAQVLTAQTTTSTSYTDLATSGPAVTLTTGTSALVLVIAGYVNTSSVGPGCAMSFAVSGATTIAASDNFRGTLSADSGYNASSISMLTKLTTLTAGSNTFTAKYRQTSASTGEYANRSITVWAI
jgi:hypothetical protein